MQAARQPGPSIDMGYRGTTPPLAPSLPASLDCSIALAPDRQKMAASRVWEAIELGRAQEVVDWLKADPARLHDHDPVGREGGAL